MEILTITLLITLIALVIFLIIKSQKSGLENKIHAMINDRFIGFQDIMHKSMETARQEVEQSKNIISDHAVKTLDTIKSMGGALEGMLQNQKESTELGNSLKYLLQTPKLRGSYGEEVLEEMLEKILPKGIWQKQYTIDGSERVDAVVKYKDTIIPIDAKFPREIYERYLNAEDKEEKKQLLDK